MARLVNKLAARLVAFLSVILIGMTIASPALAQSRLPKSANPKSATPAPLATPAITPKTSVQPYLDQVVKNISEFQLSNGMKFIVLERHNAPVISFRTYVDVGGADEDPGKTGISHFLEHLAFKGTTRIGTQDFAKEKVLLDRQDKLWESLKAAQK